MKVKNIILVGLMLIFIPVFVCGQHIGKFHIIHTYVDTGTIKVDSSLWIGGSTWISVPRDTMVIKFDTLKCVLLFSDIELKEYETVTSWTETKFTYKDFDHSTKWMIGYDVREKKDGYDNEKIESIFGKLEQSIDNMPTVRPSENIFRSKPFYYKHFCYLSENKQPLSKSIIVWQSQEIK